MEDFFRSIGMPTSISDMEIELTDTQIKELAHKCSFMAVSYTHLRAHET